MKPHNLIYNQKAEEINQCKI